MEILAYTMSKILLSDGLDSFEGGVSDINATFLDKVGEEFLSAFPH
jgi:hypothetical protein